MQVKRNIYFLQDATSANASEIFTNATGETLTIQVEGTATSFSFQLLGCSDFYSEDFYALTGFTTAFDPIATITAKGIYTFGIEGISKFKVNLTAVSGGSVTIFGKMTQGV